MSAVNLEPGEQQVRLKAFRNRVSKDGVHAEFDSVDDLLPKAMQSLIAIRDRLDDGAPAASGPQPFAAMPPYLAGSAFQGRAKELRMLRRRQ